jgi:tripartite-type tricarboxylate transporter receptor subunit TctC
MSFFRVLLAAALLMGVPLSQAQEFPSRPLKLVVPVPPGGSLDLLARTITARLAQRLGQPVQVENVSGAGGNIAFANVAKAPADGYTLLLGWDPLLINLALYQPAPFELKNFAPVTLAITAPQVLVGSPKLVARDLRELLAQAKADPRKISVGSPGNGSPGHLGLALLENLAGVDFNHIPYKGGGPAIPDALAGHIDGIFLTFPAVLPLVQQGKLRAYGVSTARRSAAAPDIPTIAEAGVAGYELASWQGFLVPAGTPTAAIAKLNREIVAILRLPEVRDPLTALGFEVAGSTPEAFDAELKSGALRWAKLVRQSGAKIE